MSEPCIPALLDRRGRGAMQQPRALAQEFCAATARQPWDTEVPQDSGDAVVSAQRHGLAQGDVLASGFGHKA